MRSICDKKLLSESERKEIFLNIGKICALNLDLLRELEIRFSNWYINLYNMMPLQSHIYSSGLNDFVASVGILTPSLLIPL